MEDNSKSIDEYPVVFDKEHFPDGLNSEFVKRNDSELAEHYGNGKGVFENPELRDIAANLSNIMEYIFDCTKEIALQNGDSVLDLGAGTGIFLEGIAKGIGECGTIHATDISRGFCDLLRQKVRSNELLKKVTRVSLVTDKKLASIDDCSCNLVMVIDVYHHLVFPFTILQEIIRVLKPNGKLLLIDYHRDSSRIKSHSAGWVESHVRADKNTFKNEVTSTGLIFVTEPSLGLVENYGLVFCKKSD